MVSRIGDWQKNLYSSGGKLLLMNTAVMADIKNGIYGEQES
ncbi:hypothetical protein Pmani_013198 [Petrolisthes manimaculis]|uniref:Uncharacterized protein n=1 Tax=Petrolisthes manimaculis TaxID=1843537 RepID=A0AAE1U9U5_9EUCA|nr:hypothetical protein Pmani_013198 [Petrolisthes manimaculis]